MNNYETIISKIIHFSNLTPKKHIGLTKKVLFKFMDIVDELDE